MLVEEGDELLGMGSVTPDGYLDTMYVSHLQQGRGIALLLMKQLEVFAGKQKASLLRSDVSITARPFFERMGFRIRAPQQVEMDGLIFDN